MYAQERQGELWAETKISVAQEHVGSAVTQSIMARLYPEITGVRSAGRALMTGAEGELHSLPAQLASDLLELEGWDVTFVGTNTPEQSVLSAIEQHEPDAIGLSVSTLVPLPMTVSLARAIRQHFPYLPVVLGGRAVRGADTLADELGVDVDTMGDLAPFRRYVRIG